MKYVLFFLVLSLSVSFCRQVSEDEEDDGYNIVMVTDLDSSGSIGALGLVNPMTGDSKLVCRLGNHVTTMYESTYDPESRIAFVLAGYMLFKCELDEDYSNCSCEDYSSKFDSALPPILMANDFKDNSVVWVEILKGVKEYFYVMKTDLESMDTKFVANYTTDGMIHFGSATFDQNNQIYYYDQQTYPLRSLVSVEVQTGKIDQAFFFSSSNGSEWSTFIEQMFWDERKNTFVCNLIIESGREMKFGWGLYNPFVDEKPDVFYVSPVIDPLGPFKNVAVWDVESGIGTNIIGFVDNNQSIYRVNSNGDLLSSVSAHGISQYAHSLFLK